MRCDAQTNRCTFARECVCHSAARVKCKGRVKGGERRSGSALSSSSTAGSAEIWQSHTDERESQRRCPVASLFPAPSSA